MTPSQLTTPKLGNDSQKLVIQWNIIKNTTLKPNGIQLFFKLNNQFIESWIK